ncbi:MAG TPA: phosphatase PAP2 family protein [Longimicrobiales bacterium]
MTRPAPDPPERWAAHRALADIVARFRDGCAGIPRAAWRRWLLALGLGYLATFLLLLALIATVHTATADGALWWEPRALDWIATRVPLSFSSAIWIQTFGTDIMLVFVILIGAGIAAWAARPFPALTIAAAYLLTDLVVRAGWMLWNRPRPGIILDGAAAPGFASFPSGHTAKTLAVYGTLAYLWGRSSGNTAERLLAATVALTIVGLVAIGRLRMGAHWPSDIAGGVIIGAAALATTIAALRAATRRRDATPPPNAPTAPAPPASPDTPPPGNTASA